MGFLAFVTVYFSGSTNHLNLVIYYRSNDISVYRLLPGMTDSKIFYFNAVPRAGYLTLFERRENASAVYREFRKFDDLLSKLARCSSKRGKLH